MPKPLIPLTVQSPGFLGLNTQQSGSVLPVGWATKLDNFVYDDVGRVASRSGTRRLNATVIPSTPVIYAAHEFIDASGNRVNILAADDKIFKEVSGTITDVTDAGMSAPAADKWQFVNFNGWCVGFQAGHVPCISTSATTPNFVDFTGADGTNFFKGSMGCSAYGRLWTVLDNTLRYSDLLIADFDGGSSGNFDLAKFWPNGMDEAVAIADFNGLLIVFGKKSIIVYENADEVESMAIVEGIDGIGCIARDSIQTIGKDIAFLSDSGVRSLGRSLGDEVMPLTDLSAHVRDALIRVALLETPVDIKSVYNPEDGFYLLSFPTAGISYCFDLKFPNEDGTWKATKWDIAPTALMYDEGHIMYMSVSAGYLSTYVNYLDESESDDSGGSAYRLDFEGVWNDFGEDYATFLKIVKNVSMLAAGTPAGAVAFKWAFDYDETFLSVILDFSGSAPPVYGGSATWGGAFAYTSGGAFQRIRNPLSSAGQVMKMGMTTTISGYAFALQRLDVLAKIGKLGL